MLTEREQAQATAREYNHECRALRDFGSVDLIKRAKKNIETESDWIEKLLGE